jgi:hypothetical protein
MYPQGARALKTLTNKLLKISICPLNQTLHETLTNISAIYHATRASRLATYENPKLYCLEAVAEIFLKTAIICFISIIEMNGH